MLNILKKKRVKPHAIGNSKSGRYAKKRAPEAVQKIIDGADRFWFDWAARDRFYMHLSAQLENGMSPEMALKSYEKRMEKRNKKALTRIMSDARRRMRDGASLSEALGDWIPHDERGSIDAGVGRKLADVLVRMVAVKREVLTIKRMFMSAMTQPIIYIFACYLVLWFFGTYVTPSLANLVPPSRASGMVSHLYTLSAFATSWWAILPPIFVLILAGGVLWSLPNWTGPGRVKAEQYFPWSYYRDVNGNIWMSNYSVMRGAGINDKKILHSQALHASPWLRERLKSAEFNLSDGGLLDEALDKPPRGKSYRLNFPSPDIIDDIASFSSYSDFSERLDVLANRQLEEIKYETEKRLKKYEFAATFFVYALIGFLVFAINDISTQMSSIAGKF